MTPMDLFSALNDAMGLSLESQDLDIGHMAVRAIVAYVLVLAIARVGHQRMLDSTSAFDIILGILLGSIASRAITGNAPFYPAIGACGVLVAMHALFAAVAFRWHFFGFLVKGRSKVLVRDGTRDRKQMRTSHIAEHDLDEALRLEGTAKVEGVAVAHLERNGHVSVIEKPKEPRVIEIKVADGVQTIKLELG